MESLAGDMLDTDLYSDLKEEDAHDVAYSEVRKVDLGFRESSQIKEVTKIERSTNTN